MKGHSSRLRRLRQRLGARQELIAGVLLAVLAAGGLGFTLITHTAARLTPANSHCV